MGTKNKKICFLLTGALLLQTILLGGCASDSASASDGMSEVQAKTVDISDMFTDRDYEIGYDEENSAVILLEQDSAQCDSDAVEISGSQVTITDEGTYILRGTLEDGMVIIDAEDTDKVQIVLDGAQITSSTSAALYVRSADKVFVTTAADSDNTLCSSGSYEAIDDNNIDGAVFSKDDLTLNGAGVLMVSSAEGHGIVSKDDLAITSGTYTITAEKQGLSGKDSVRIAGGTFTITTKTDSIHADSSDDGTLGFVYIGGGTFTIASGDDAVHADGSVVIADGTLNITESYEGIEGQTIDITGGEIHVTASDDGLNAAGGNDESGTMERNGFGAPDSFAADADAYIHISGGILYINASGDGIDSNGSLTVSGGETYVSGPSDGGNGAMDYAGEAAITGGIFVAAGMSQMAQNFGSSSTQGAMMVTVNSQQAGTVITLKDESGEKLVSWQADKSYNSVVVSCPGISEGGTYTLVTGEDETEVTMSSLIYSVGGMGGMGGAPGDMGGQGGMRGGTGNGGEIPDDAAGAPGGGAPNDMGGGRGMQPR